MATKKRAQTSSNRQGKGNRYSEGKRKRIIAFVDEVNSAKGRGGITAASKKFGVSPLSISNWIKKAGARAKTVSGATPSRKVGVWERMVTLRAEIDNLEQEAGKKRKEFDKLKKKL